MLGVSVREELTATIEFIDPSFDLSSVLPAESNQCYGMDVAEMIRGALADRGYTPDVIEENWGWAVTGKVGGDGQVEIGVYPWGYLDDAPGQRLHLWRLRLTYYESKRLLGVIPVLRQAEFPRSVGESIKSVLTETVHEFVRLDYGEVWT